MKTITGKAVALCAPGQQGPQNEVSSYVIVSPCALDEGVLRDVWANIGYVYAGDATVEITLRPDADTTADAVAAIEAQQRKVLAESQAEITRLEAQKQSLLAITNEVTE